MSRTEIRIYTDEDVAGAVAKALKRRGFEVSTTPEHGNLELTDEEQLKFATLIGAALLTHSVQDFRFMEKGALTQGGDRGQTGL